MRDKKHTRGGLLLCTLLIAGLLPIGCGEKVQPGASGVKRPVIGGVSVAQIVPRRIEEFTEAAGTVKAAQTSSVAGRVMGTVTSLLVKEGDRVAKGQLLLTIDDRDVLQKVRAAEAGSREAAKALRSAEEDRRLSDLTYSRYKKMYDEKAISRQEMDQYETRKQVALLEEERMLEVQKRADAGLAEAKVMLGYTRVASPLAGRITEKKIDVGSMAVPGVPLLTVENAADFNAEISVDEKLAGKLTVGTPVAVTVESVGRQISGKIVQVIPAVDPQSRTFTVKVSLGGGLRSGLYARVRIPQGTARQALLVPRAAVVERGQLTGLYAVDSRGIVTYRLVRTGKEYGGDVEILSGLKPNEHIIVQGVDKAVDGGVLGKGTGA